MEDCIFCKIIKNEIPSNKIYEDDKCLAFLTINPNNDGHTLLIPKTHYRSYFETPDEVLKDLAVETKRIGLAIQKAMGAEGMNIANNSEKAAGQIVFHTHIHLIPRFGSDGFKHWGTKEYTGNKAEQIVEKIKAELS